MTVLNGLATREVRLRTEAVAGLRRARCAMLGAGRSGRADEAC